MCSKIYAKKARESFTFQIILIQYSNPFLEDFARERKPCWIGMDVYDPEA
jgi:hypothetical protein